MTLILKIFISTLISLLGLATYANTIADDLLFPGRAIPVYGQARTPEHEALLNTLKKGQWAERFSNAVNSTTKLKKNLFIVITGCGRANAFFSPAKSSITMCLEMFDQISKNVKEDSDTLKAQLGINALPKVQRGVIWGIYFHELGHAIKGINDLALTGREEDVADQISFYYGLRYAESEGFAITFPVVWFWQLHANNSNTAGMTSTQINQTMANEHSWDSQRAFNIACWAYGSRREFGVEIAKFVQLPAQRAQRCEHEFTDLVRAVESNLKKYLRPQKIAKQ